MPGARDKGPIFVFITSQLGITVTLATPPTPWEHVTHVNIICHTCLSWATSGTRKPSPEQGPRQAGAAGQGVAGADGNPGQEASASPVGLGGQAILCVFGKSGKLLPCGWLSGAAGTTCP